MIPRWMYSVLLIWPLSLGAQELQTVAFIGQVVDSVTHAPIPGAVVRLNARTATVTDHVGQFSLTLPVVGTYFLQVEQFGYETSQLLVQRADLGAGMTILLRPRPVELEGFAVLVRGQLERRRFLSARQVSIVTAADIAETGGFGVELIRRLIPLTRGCYDESGEPCFGFSDSKQFVSFCIDDQPVFEGVSELDRFQPWELHTIELFDSGRHVRVYTGEFMRDVFAGKRSLRPLGWCLGV